MRASLLALAILLPVQAQFPQTTATGMLEYLSRTAVVIRLPDNREIQIKIPPTAPELTPAPELGDWVDVTFQPTAPTLDKNLNLMLHVGLTEIHPFHKPSPIELETAEASPIQHLAGNLLADSNPQPSDEDQPLTPGPLLAVRRQVKTYLSRMPSYIADEVTTRFTSVDTPPQWTQIDQIQDQIRFDRHHEIRTNISVNGKLWNRPYEALPGIKWRAAYAARLRAVFSHPDKVTFFDQQPGRFDGHIVWIYSFRAPADSISHWFIGEQGFWPATEGKAWVSVQDGAVYQLETKSASFPPDFPISEVNERITFDSVQIGAGREILPVTSEVFLVRRDSGNTFLNRNTYSNYRYFEPVPLVAANLY